MSSRLTNPDSRAAMAHRAQAVRSFLDRHGFSDVNGPRELEEPHRIQMKPVYPIEVATDLGKEAMVQMLLDAGAVMNPTNSVRNPDSAPSPTPTGRTSKGSLFSFGSFRGSRGEKAAASPLPEAPDASKPLKSCLSGSRSRLESCSSDGDPVRSRWV